MKLKLWRGKHWQRRSGNWSDCNFPFDKTITEKRALLQAFFRSLNTKCFNKKEALRATKLIMYSWRGIISTIEIKLRENKRVNISKATCTITVRDHKTVEGNVIWKLRSVIILNLLLFVSLYFYRNQIQCDHNKPGVKELANIINKLLWKHYVYRQYWANYSVAIKRYKKP